jgi:hypothetical protein
MPMEVLRTIVLIGAGILLFVGWSADFQPAFILAGLGLTVWFGWQLSDFLQERQR